MNFTVDQLLSKFNKPLLYVHYNELIDQDTVMLSQANSKNDYFDKPIALYEGLEIVGYQNDEDVHGFRDDIIMEGVFARNQTQHSCHVKWLIKANSNGIRYISDIIKEES